MSSPAEHTPSAPPGAPVSRTRGGDPIAVELDRVTKRFGAITALDDVSLVVARGELMTLLGPSGCGKTTLLNLVAGFLLPDSGEIAIAGRRMVLSIGRFLGVNCAAKFRDLYQIVSANTAARCDCGRNE